MNKDNSKLNGYKAFYKNKTIEVWAETSYKAQLIAAELFKAKKSHQVSVILCERASGEQVIYSP